MTLLLLGWILQKTLHDWDRDLRGRPTAAGEDHQLDSAHQLCHSLILLFHAAFFLCLARGLVEVWDYYSLLISRVKQLFDVTFIIGLILLLERPVKVGDTIEINGMWSEVKKINVRATVVQTFDNASVIIPD